MRADEITGFAKEACAIIELYQGITAKQAERIETLEKQANGKPATVTVTKTMEFDAAKLEKAANAVHEAFGQPSNYPAESIAKFWRENPDAMSTTIHKLASKLVSAAAAAVENTEDAEDADLGRVINKKASTDTNTDLTVNGSNDAAATNFWGNFK